MVLSSAPIGGEELGHIGSGRWSQRSIVYLRGMESKEPREESNAMGRAGSIRSFMLIAVQKCVKAETLRNWRVPVDLPQDVDEEHAFDELRRTCRVLAGRILSQQ